MANPLVRDEKRDLELIADYQLRNEDDTGWVYSMRDLMIKYEISDTRIYQILKHYKVPLRNPKKV